MQFPRNKAWWAKSLLVFALAGGALELALLPSYFSLFAFLGLGGILYVFFRREGFGVMLWRKATLPLLFLLGLSVFIHFSQLNLWIIEILMAISAWIVTKLYWEAKIFEEEALTVLAVLLYALAFWELDIRNLLPMWANLIILGGSVTTLASFRLSLFGEPIKLAIILGSFVALNTLEMAFVLTFWPASIILKAIVILIAFYLQISLLLSSEKGKMTLKKALIPIAISVVLLILLFLTFRWQNYF